ncbi:MAG TPA: aminopeptidase [Saprospiraceae bacterium]|nr:aminopeptidase [Saprospiraceae bacterium]
MNIIFIKKYASLLLNYCMELKSGERLLVSTTTLAEPLVAELYRQCQQMGVIMEAILEWEGKSDDFNDYGHNAQAGYINPLYKEAMESFEAYLVIRAPFPSKSRSKPNSTLNEVRAAANAQFHKLYFERTATRNLRRNLCQYPTQAGADLAGMSLEEYTSFVVNACFLNTDNPEQEWLNVRARQQSITDLLNSCKEFRYLSPNMDISFRTEGRRWINSDGQTNMPSGEIYTSPEENSVNGHILFTLPSLYQGHLLNNVRLEVRDGYITSWTCDNDIDILNEVFRIEGTRRFGEAAIGTNYRIDRLTKNILYDEKIGGTVHMAIGQSYLQAGGKNESSVHWDMISDMKDGGKIYADGQLVYENGKFLEVIKE